jgi:hypothetical protein
MKTTTPKSLPSPLIGERPRLQPENDTLRDLTVAAVVCGGLFLVAWAVLWIIFMAIQAASTPFIPL